MCGTFGQLSQWKIFPYRARRQAHGGVLTILAMTTPDSSCPDPFIEHSLL
jgi:hypothetical protein